MFACALRVRLARRAVLGRVVAGPRRDGGDGARSYGSRGLEAGYGFARGDAGSRGLRVFGRVDNALGIVHEDTFPVEPRAFMVGTAVEL